MLKAESSRAADRPSFEKKVQLSDYGTYDDVSYKYGVAQFWKDSGGGTQGNVTLMDEGKKVKLSGDLASYNGSQIALVLPFDTPRDIRKVNILLNGSLKIGQKVRLKLVANNGSVLKTREIATDALDKNIPRMAEVDFGEIVEGAGMVLLSVWGNGAAGTVNLDVQGLGGLPPVSVSIVTAMGVEGSYTDNSLGRPSGLNKAKISGKDNGIEISGILNSENDWLGLGYRFNDPQDINQLSILLKGEIPSGQKLKVKVFGDGGKLLRDYQINTQLLTNENFSQASILDRT
ncbi:hypothetical protein ACFLQ8_04025, partial [Candidatus Auribacterota bacterium]